jgi:hypothetical protein
MNVFLPCNLVIIYMCMNVFLLCIFNYRLMQSLDYACFLDIVVHVVKSVILFILND